ncbi:PriCT-2 domain-containing protein [Polynucleobacter sp. MWH-CaK5]|jgi:P4 family phage/plasmid primase-like protien|uniref:phage/plasmid primase, P4 family n=1 Tax=Polynucleobacter sp. MWH-CaK5 TaxID=2689107 RepID=UPI001BFEA3E1|nr:phage/plasmid primase, P4 family [Polynucleobacter sp. MWH-CaK5]QWD88543.1 PriCT-2 domain-containing protein [Polynucleobacter sp. MWH-CaK5]
MKLDQMPQELRAIKNWVLVKLAPRNDGNYDKVPVGIRKGQTYELAWGNPSNRSSFETVKALLQKELALGSSERRFHGIGFVLNDTDYMCVDLDKAFIGDSLKPFAKDILASLHGFVEKSVSHTGLHIFIKKHGWDIGTKRGKFADGSGIDVLCSGTFVMVTGDTIDDASYTISETQDFSELHKWRKLLNGSENANTFTNQEITFDHNIPVAGWCVERIRKELLPRLEDFADRDNWRDVCFALHHQTQGSPEGLKLFHEYSERIPEMYNPDEVEALWKSTKLNPNRLNKTFRWLLHLVRQEIIQNQNHIMGDLDNARYFKAMFEGEFLFCHSNRKWLRFNGMRWEWCQKDEQMGAAKLVAEQIMEKAGELFKLDPRGAISRAWQSHAKTIRNNGRIIAMLDLAASEPGMSISSISELDNQPMLLGVENGVLDLKNMKLLPADPKLLISRQARADYNRAATCPLWLKFLDEIFLGDQDVVRYIQKALGYSLTGDVSEELLHFCYGHGKNGKSVMANVIVKIMGDYVQTANFDLLAMKDSTASNDVARLVGARLVMANETRENQRLDDQKLKALVSTEKLTARFMYAEYFEFWPQFKIWLRGNYKPIITDSSNGAWRRMRLVPFEYHVPEEKTDFKIEEKLLAEKEGILAWMVDGCHLWQQERLVAPKRIADASRIYQEESDMLGEFLEDCCEVGADKTESQKAVYGSYKLWTLKNGTHAVTQKSFTRQLGSRGVDTKRVKEQGDTKRYYVGLTLTEAAQGRWKQHDFE